MKYRQCALEKKTKRGKKVKTSWVIDKDAVIGNYVKFEGDFAMEKGWKVMNVGITRETK